MGLREVSAEITRLRERGHGYHRMGRHGLALESYRRAIVLAEPLGDVALTASLLRDAGGEHRDCDNYYHAIDLLMRALLLAPDDGEIELKASIKKILAITFRDVYSSYMPDVLQLLH